MEDGYVLRTTAFIDLNKQGRIHPCNLPIDKGNHCIPIWPLRINLDGKRWEMRKTSSITKRPIYYEMGDKVKEELSPEDEVNSLKHANEVLSDKLESCYETNEKLICNMEKMIKIIEVYEEMFKNKDKNH